MQAEHVTAFLGSAFDVLGRLAEARPERGSPVLRTGDSHSTRELNALVALNGDLVGVIFCSMSLATGSKLAATIKASQNLEAESADDDAIGELVRLISQTGAERLGQQQCTCAPQAPVLIHGFGEALTNVSPVLVVPLYTEYGDIDIGVALQPPADNQLATLRLETAAEDPNDQMAVAS